MAWKAASIGKRQRPGRMAFCEVCEFAGSHRQGCPAVGLPKEGKRFSPAETIARRYGRSIPPALVWDGFEDAVAGVVL